MHKAIQVSKGSLSIVALIDFLLQELRLSESHLAVESLHMDKCAESPTYNHQADCAYKDGKEHGPAGHSAWRLLDQALGGVIGDA